MKPKKTRVKNKVCVWEASLSYSGEYATICGMYIHNPPKDFKYCPYCGKKIEVKK